MTTSSFLLPVRTQTQTFIEVSLVALLFICAVSGNIIVCCAVYKKTNLRTIPNAIFVNLAVSNLLLALWQLPMLIITIIRGEWSFGEKLCNFYAFLDVALFAVSLFNLTAISVNRYFKIVKPSKYRSVFFKKSVIFMTVLIWCLAILLSSGPFLGWGKYQFIPSKAICSISEKAHISIRITSYVVISCCILVIIGCYIKIAQVVRRHRRRIAVPNNRSQDEDPKQVPRPGPSRATTEPHVTELRGEDIHIARTVSVIVFLFCLSWVPNVTLNILVSRGVPVSREVRMFGVYMMFLDLVINPMTFGIRNREIRKMIKRLFCKN